MEVGIKRVELAVNKKRSVVEAEIGESVRLSRSGRGSISNDKKNYPTKIEELLEKAYKSARDAANY